MSLRRGCPKFMDFPIRPVGTIFLRCLREEGHEGDCDFEI